MKKREIRLTKEKIEKRIEKLKKRMNMLYREILAAEDAIKLFNEEISNALSKNWTQEGTIDGTSESQGTRGLQLPIQSSNVEPLVEERQSEVLNNPPTEEVSL